MHCELDQVKLGELQPTNNIHPMQPATDIMRILDGSEAKVRLGNAHPTSNRRVLFPGSFNPLHNGHLQIAQHAERLTSTRTEFEIAICNVDKQSLNRVEIERRFDQFSLDQTVWITRAATFVEKARLFPNTWMLVGTDTIERIGHPKYYANDLAVRDAVIDEIAQLHTRFIVYGRLFSDNFKTLSEIEIPCSLRDLCERIDESEFRCDISSTELRQPSNRAHRTFIQDLKQPGRFD